MHTLTLFAFTALTLSVFADVPALINYQGRLVDGVGNPIAGKKEFKLDIYDSQTEGTLIYQETLPEITLDEDGAYSFQFGAGESRSETSVVIATGDGEAAFFQKVFEQTPVGVISVTDGTNTFKTGDVPTGEEPFSFTYTASLKRLNLVCNEPPAEGVKFTATFRYAESGIMGALGSAAEHWMEVTIGGEKQEPRQRLVAVPFALRAVVAEVTEKSDKLKSFVKGWDSMSNSPSMAFDVLIDPIRTIKRIKVNTYGLSPENVFRIVRVLKDDLTDSSFLLDTTENSALNSFEVVFFGSVTDDGKPFVDFKGLNLVLDHDRYYYFPYMYRIYDNTNRPQARLPAFLEIFYTES
ncbi:hypothetical protein N9920_00570 [Akkermansiaceae bacterium]|nr:hypothetical protein [Akkermansiaceae bacterium]